MVHSAYLKALAVPVWRRRALPAALSEPRNVVEVTDDTNQQAEPRWLRGSETADVIFVLEHTVLSADEQTLLDAITTTQAQSVAWLAVADPSIAVRFANARLVIFSDESCELTGQQQRVPS